MNPFTLRYSGRALAVLLAAGTISLSCSLTPAPAPEVPVNDTNTYVGTWAASQYLVEAHNMPPKNLSNSTLRQIIKVSLGGEKIRLRFSNRVGNGPLEIKGVSLAKHDIISYLHADTLIRLSFGGKASVTIPAGEEVYCDAVAYPLAALDTLAVSIYFGSVPTALTGHPGSRTTSYILPGDHLEKDSMQYSDMAERWYVLAGLDIVDNEGSKKAVVCLGDSITDGRGTTTDAQNRWTDGLARRLKENPATAHIAVLNQGIGGTTVTGSGRERFERDVLAQAGAAYLIILYGVNDILYAGQSAQAVIKQYKDLISRAKARGLAVYGGTILPFEGFDRYNEQTEAARQEINAWIRDTTADEGGFDASIDFDAACRDPERPTRLLPACNSGDGLHPSPIGYRTMAEAVELALFAK